MASYVVLARKWRSAQFADIVGQGHIVRTLMNAIRSERIHQAYLFTGSRGIGKTSIARIFAKAVRCENTTITPDGWLKSCDECASCKEIAQGNSVDVIEIDGASNNGVDAVREIRENAKYLPSTGKRKVYIIDEVHMLTTAAFNALLKTLEEPPPHVIFIFATTEPHKIPATILSRVQRFDFRKHTIAQIQARLAEITRAEGIEADPGALALIARAGEGSMRDALSLLDQVIAFSGSKITTESTRESIGLIEGQTLMGILKAVAERKPLEAVALVDQAYQQGHDLRVLTRSLIELLHAAILAKVGSGSPASLELSGDEWKELQEIASRRSLEELELIFQVLHYGVDWIARSPQPKIVLDVLLVKCATAEALIQVRSAGTGSAGNTGGGAKPAVASSAHPTAMGGPKQPAMGAAAPVAVPVAVKEDTGPSTAASIAASLVAQTPAAAPKPAPAASTSPAPGAATSVPEPVAAPAPTTAPRAAYAGGDPWEGFIAHVRQTRPLLASILEHGSCANLPGKGDDPTLLEICFNPDDAYFREQLQSRVYAEQLATLGKEFFGQPQLRIKLELRELGESLAAKREREMKQRETSARAAAKNHPIITEARSLFGGELGPIELTGSEDGMEKH